jgi:hypothetical protein
MRLNEETPHPGNEAKAVTVGGQIYEGSARVRSWERGISDPSWRGSPEAVQQAWSFLATN